MFDVLHSSILFFLPTLPLTQSTLIPSLCIQVDSILNPHLPSATSSYWWKRSLTEPVPQTRKSAIRCFSSNELINALCLSLPRWRCILPFYTYFICKACSIIWQLVNHEIKLWTRNKNNSKQRIQSISSLHLIDGWFLLGSFCYKKHH